MPEGHTIHRLARDISEDLRGHALVATSPQGRFEDVHQIDGRVLRRTEAIGKHLLLHFAGSKVVHIHLGLFGKFRRRRAIDPVAPRDACRLRLVGPRFLWDLSGPTKCEVIEPKALRELRERIGADPLASDADVDATWKKFHATKREVGAVLLDQRIFSGIGNVYRAEILFLLGIHPQISASDIPRRTFDKIWNLAKDLLARGVEANRIITVDHAVGAKVKRAEALHIYSRRTCRACEGPVTRAKIGNRALDYCRVCQPLR